MKLKSRPEVLGVIKSIEDSTFTIWESTPNQANDHVVTFAYEDVEKVSPHDCCI